MEEPKDESIEAVQKEAPPKPPEPAYPQWEKVTKNGATLKLRVPGGTLYMHNLVCMTFVPEVYEYENALSEILELLRYKLSH